MEAGGVAIEAAQAVADGAALSEWRDARAVPVEVGQYGQQSQYVGAHALGLVDNEQHRDVALVGEPADLLLDNAQRQGSPPPGLEPEPEGDLTAGVGRVGGVVNVAAERSCPEDRSLTVREAPGGD